MCIMCYVGTHSQLEERDDNNLGILKVDRSDFDEETFSVNNIYQISTRDGCGCLFARSKVPHEVILAVSQLIEEGTEIPARYQRYFEFEESIEGIVRVLDYYRDSAEDIHALYTLIRRHCERDGQVEFFGCWAENEKQKPDRVKQRHLELAS